MDAKKLGAGLLTGTAFLAGLEFESPDMISDVQQKINAPETRLERLVGRLDDGPETRPYAPQTFQGVVAMITTSSGDDGSSRYERSPVSIVLHSVVR